jgi:nitroreductase
MNADQILDFLLTRRSIREFSQREISRATLERLIQAATSAPSNTNRQPWRFAVVTSAAKKRAIAHAVRDKAEQMKAIIRQGHHAEDFGNYSDFFHEPLESAAAIIVPQYRDYPDLIANLIASGGGDPEKFHTASSMQAELCSTSAACMALLLQAHAEDLGACWMAGPMIGKVAIDALLDIREPWRMVGAIALGYPMEKTVEAKPRKPQDRVVMWFNEEA